MDEIPIEQYYYIWLSILITIITQVNWQGIADCSDLILPTGDLLKFESKAEASRTIGKVLILIVLWFYGRILAIFKGIRLMGFKIRIKVWQHAKRETHKFNLSCFSYVIVNNDNKNNNNYVVFFMYIS